MTESLYDLLGIEPTATESEIKSAWRSLVTVLGPTDHRFASINDAASVLLDADKRAAYDATLAEPASPAAVVDEPASPAGVVDTPAEAETLVADEPDAAAPHEAVEPVEDAAIVAPEAESVAEPEAAATPDAAAGSIPVSARRSAVVDLLASRRVALVAALLAVALVVATSIAYLVHDSGQKVSERTITVHLTDANVKPITATVQTRETADVTAALSAAVTAVPNILSFDYRSIDTWAKTATPFMTANFIKTYMPYFDGMVKPNAKRVHGVVKLSPVLDAGVVSTAPGVIVVLVIVDAQTATANQTVIAQDFAVLTMAKTNGRWLVDKFGTAPIPKS